MKIIALALFIALSAAALQLYVPAYLAVVVATFRLGQIVARAQKEE